MSMQYFQRSRRAVVEFADSPQAAYELWFERYAHVVVLVAHNVPVMFTINICPLWIFYIVFDEQPNISLRVIIKIGSRVSTTVAISPQVQVSGLAPL